jgi:glycosyltransferase involved in cell wall biosynthesis
LERLRRENIGQNVVPLVSVIIPTHNRARLVERAIRSVLDQDFTDFELIVVDDGSTDSTKTLLESFQGRLKPIVQENKGVSAARNRGIRSSRGALLAFLDSDDEWLPKKLTRQVELYSPERPLFICHTGETWIRDGREVPQRNYHRKQGGLFFERALKRCLISPSSVMVSRRLLDEVGWFDESLPAAEDFDLWLRITAFHDVDFIPESLVIKHGGANDQLSVTVPAIDRFRIKAIMKIASRSDLMVEYREAAIRELQRKCRIVAAGCAKKGKVLEAAYYRELARTHPARNS